MMNAPRISRRQAGFTLIELLVSIGISLIAVAGMILVMANTVGATADTLQATRLSTELRTAMQVVSRDLRRANFDEDFANCIGIGDVVCSAVTPDTFKSVATDGSECLAYGYRRQNSSGVWALTSGAIRLNSGVLQFNPTNGTCTATTGWQDITDGNIVQITDFNWDNNLGYTETVSSITQDIRKIRLTLTGRICLNGALSGCTNYSTRSIESIVQVRNPVFYAAPTTN